jgi:dolichol-phosphate mannosyltransferase
MKTIAIGPMYNEGEKVVQTVRRFPLGMVDEIVIVNDASKDGADKKVAEIGVTVLSMPQRSGPGPAIRKGIEYGLQKGYDVFVIFATNGKDDPREIEKLLQPIRENRADFVQGSRYLEGGAWKHMPFHRVWGVRLFSLLFLLMVGRKITDGTNGFRAIRRTLFEDSRINLWQDWLEGYPLETYLFVQAIRLGYRVVEVPVTKTYPSSKKNYTKMRPLIDWWNYFKPVPLLTLRLKK